MPSQNKQATGKARAEDTKTVADCNSTVSPGKVADAAAAENRHAARRFRHNPQEDVAECVTSVA